MIKSRAQMPAASVMIEIEGWIEDLAVSDNFPYSSVIKGIVWQESKFDKLSYRYNMENPADRSYGLMHLTLPTASEVATKAYGYIVNVTEQDLYDPIFNLWLGIRYLQSKYQKYGNWDHAIASYNSGSPRYKASGVLINQGYVNIVKKAANILSGWVTTASTVSPAQAAGVLVPGGSTISFMVESAMDKFKALIGMK